MKKKLLILAIIFPLFSSANYFDAQDEFNKGEFEQAFIKFQGLSKLGNRQAQYNLAQMHYFGKGTPKDILKAYSWSKLIESYHPQFKELHEKIKSELLETNVNEINDDGFKAFDYDTFKLNYGPDKKSENQKINTNSDDIHFKRSKKSKYKIDYPREVIDEGARGWVDILFNIYPDGSVRNIYIKNQYPHKKFAESAIDFMSKQHYIPMNNNSETPLKKPRFYIQRLQYGVQGISGLLSKEQKLFLEELMKSALSGNVESQYKYVKYYNTVLNKSSSVSSFVIANWIFQAAQYGIIDAQFMMGYTLYYGHGCKKDISKGLMWLQKAAQAGHPQANYYLYQILENEDIENNTAQTADYWLKQAVNFEYPIAQFVYAKSLIENSTELKTAQEYLDNYSNNIGKTIDWYHTQIQLFEKTGALKANKKLIKKAKKLAKKHGWDLSLFENIKT